MKQIEITLKVNNSLSEVDKILSKQGFKIIRKSRIEDNYLCYKNKKITAKNIINVLSSCVLIRYLKVGNDEFKKITYKEKKYNKKTVISESKINVSIDDIGKANSLFEKIGFKNIVSVNYDVIVYSNGKYEFAFQNVEGLGLLVEFENEDDFESKSTKEIILEKEKMVNIIKDFNLDVGTDYDVKKAYQLILNSIEEDSQC